MEGESKKCDGVYLHLGESYRTRDESSMGEAIISSQVCLTARKKKKRREICTCCSQAALGSKVSSRLGPLEN